MLRATVLLLLLLLASCANDGFVTHDGRPLPQIDAGTEGLPWLFDGQPPRPDAFVVISALEMYAHSGTQLFAIEAKSLALSLIGTFGPQAPAINDLAVTPDGKLYAISSNDLWQVDRDTAQITWVAKVQGTSNVALTFEASGTLLASDQDGMLRRIDPKTGAVKDIGLHGPGLSASGDLVAIKDGTLFGVNDGGSAATNNDLMTVDPLTGKGHVIGPIGFPKVWGLAYWKGTVYGLTQAGLLLAIDPKTGKGTLVQSFAEEFYGAAVTPLAPIE